MLEAAAIADLEIAPSKYEDDIRTPTAASQAPPSQTPFVDPAILSYDRSVRQAQSRASIPQTPVSPIMIADGAVPSPNRPQPPRNLRGQSSVSSIATQTRKPSRRDSTATATLTEPFDALAVKEKQTPQEPATSEKRKSQTGPGIIDLRDVNHSPVKNNKSKAGKGRGWRNTPLIEEKPRSGQKGRGRHALEDQNGWATEEATDIADMGDFDFAENLAKFDKAKVFGDIQRDDTTADEDRLVSFNRKARPGTNGGRNLHYTENVLDIPDTQDAGRWKSEAGETEDEILRDDHYSSGRNSRRAGSRRPQQSRKGSALPAHMDRKEPSPRPLARITTGSPLNGSVSSTRASFKIASNNKPCHAVSPLQMLELEQLCSSELGLTEDMLTENAGRSIAEAILKFAAISAASALNSVPAQTRTPDIKNVLFLLGNHKSAARALAAARHLRNRRLRVTVCLVGLERGEDQLLEIVKKQLKIYKLSLGHLERWEDYQAKLANSIATTSSNQSAQPPDFVVDGLLGVHHAFEELRTDDQATVFSMIKWTNLSASKHPARTPTTASTTAIIPVLSIDVPSGLSATSGIAAEADGQPLVMASSQIVCLGAPKSGLLACMAGDRHNTAVDHSSWAVCVADIGISLVAWQRNGSRRKQGVEFGGEWVLPVRLVSTLR